MNNFYSKCLSVGFLISTKTKWLVVKNKLEKESFHLSIMRTHILQKRRIDFDKEPYVSSAKRSYTVVCREKLSCHMEQI